MNFFYIFLVAIFAFSQVTLAENGDYISLPIGQDEFISNINSEEYNLNLREKSKQKLELNAPLKKLDTKLFNSKEDMVKHYLQAQKKLDIEDIKILWESTVQRNPVIKFALKKLSLPADQRRINSSRLAKTVSALISGASLLPALLGTDPITASVTSVGGGLANRVISQKSLPKEMPLTDTELIQLARLIENLQDKVIKNYYAYKGNLKAYKLAKEDALKHNGLYSEALKSKNMTQILTSKALHDKALTTERELRQNIKLNRLQLERLAGSETVNDLNLGKVDLSSEIKVADASLTKNFVKKAILRKKQGVITGKLDYSGSNVQVIAEEISFELEEEKKELLLDLQILWEAAVAKSDTIRFAILKLSKPEGEVEKTTAIKKILSPLANVAPVVGMGFSDPVTAGGAMFGGGLLNSLLSDDKKLNARFSKVTDADLVMLAQETDALQEKLVIFYYDYLNAIMQLNSVTKTVEENKEYLDITQRKNPDLACVANVFYEEIVNAKFKAEQNLLNKRAALEQFVGNQSLILVDENIKERLTF